MTNEQIANYLKSVGNFSTSLWDKPRPQWTADDFKVLLGLKKQYKTKQYRKRKNAPNRIRIMRLSDGVVYDSLTECGDDIGNPTANSLCQAFKGNKNYKNLLNRFKKIE